VKIGVSQQVADQQPVPQRGLLVIYRAVLTDAAES
jgi:hypothetical protein